MFIAKLPICTSRLLGNSSASQNFIEPHISHRPRTHISHSLLSLPLSPFTIFPTTLSRRTTRSGASRAPLPLLVGDFATPRRSADSFAVGHRRAPLPFCKRGRRWRRQRRHDLRAGRTAAMEAEADAAQGRRRKEKGEVVAAISSKGGGGHLPSPRRRSLLSLLCLSLSSPAATAISSGRGGGHIPSPAGGLSPPPVPLPLSPAEAAAISSDESSRASRGEGEREGGGSRSRGCAAAPLPVDGISPLRGSSTLPSSSPVVAAVAYGAGGGDESHDGAAPLSLLPPVPLPCNARSSLHSNEFFTRNPCPILAPRSSLGHG